MNYVTRPIEMTSIENLGNEYFFYDSFDIHLGRGSFFWACSWDTL